MMALAETEVAPQIVTYEQYLAGFWTEPVTTQRYDIINGVRVFRDFDMTSPIREHQPIAKRIFRALLDMEIAGHGVAQFAPLDVLTLRAPLRTRQPDLLFISNKRLAEGGGPPATGPMTTAPELVVEILSNSDTRRVLNAKIADFCTAGVQECWVISPNAESVEVLRLTINGPHRVGIHGVGERVTSLAFPEMTVTIADIFDV